MDDRVVLAIRNLSKTFPGQVAVRGVDLDIRAGEIHALCGQNGSGKSTLIKVLSGFHEPDPGARLTFLGGALEPGSDGSHGRMRFIHQDLGLIGSLDAAENMALGTMLDRRPLAPLQRRRGYREARRALALLGMDIDVTVPVSNLVPVERAMIAIARAMQGWEGDGGLLVLDEPTVSLPLREVQRLFDAVRRVRDRGAGVLYVSHHLDEVFELADRVSVLRDGELVMTAAVDGLEHDRLVHAIVGRELESAAPLAPAAHGDVRLALRGIRAGRLRDLSLELRAGEVLGVTGLVGSGIEQLPEVAFGVLPVDAGRIAIDGTDAGRLTPHRAIERGLALVPADRATKGCIMEHTIRENLTLPELGSLASSLGGVSTARERRDASRWAARVELQPGSLERPIAQLSGGNQQKVLIARWLRTAPRILLLHEPTQGVDVGAKAAIHRLIAEAARAGMAVLMVSTDMEELASTADRVIVLDHGRLVDELGGGALNPEHLTARLLAASQAPS